MMCVDANQDGKVDFHEFTDRFHNPAKDIGFTTALLLTNLSEHMPNDPRFVNECFGISNKAYQKSSETIDVSIQRVLHILGHIGEDLPQIALKKVLLQYVHIAVVHLRRGNRDNLGLISHISP